MIRAALLAVLPLPAGYLLDLLLGDPAWMPHPVRLMGSAIQKSEPILRKAFPKTQKGELAAGTVLALFVPLVFAGLTAVLLFLAAKIHLCAQFALESLLCYQSLAARDLRDESTRVYTALQSNDPALARQMLSRIVGRDTKDLSEREIIAATVETISENTTDGVVAPMLFLGFGGAWGMFYKAVNTLDSMVGYKNEQYRRFGAASARLDDVCGFFPARIAAALMLAASLLPWYDCKGAWRIFIRDRNKHESPNSAQTESVCAGALGIRLGGGARYGGVFRSKPPLGNDTRPAQANDIRLANCMMLLASILCLLLVCALKMAIYVFILYV